MRLALAFLLFILCAPSFAHRNLNRGIHIDFYCNYYMTRAAMGKVDFRNARVVGPVPEAPSGWWNKLVYGFLGPEPIPATSFEFDVFYRNQELKGLRAVKDVDLDSYRVSLESRVPSNADFMMTFAHGFGGAKTSHMGTTAPWIRTFFGLDKQGKRIQREWKEAKRQDLVIAAETFDMPESGHGSGPTNAYRFNTYDDIDETVARFNSYQTKLRGHGNGKTRFGWLGQSASTELITHFNRVYPQALDFMVLVGPLHRDPAMGFQHSHDLFIEESELPHDDPNYFVPNWNAFHWVNRMYRQMPKFRSDEDPSGGKPMLILVGENDTEVSLKAREYYEGLSRIHPNIRFVIVPNAGHSVLTSTSSYDPTFAYTQVYEFLDAIRGAN